MGEDAFLGEIRAELARRRLRQSDLARMLGRTDVWVSSRLTGQTRMSVQDLRDIAGALGVTVSGLLRESA